MRPPLAFGESYMMNTHRSDEENAPQTLVGISFENILSAQEFLIAASSLAAAGQLILTASPFAP